LLSNVFLALAVSVVGRATGFLLFFLIARRVTTAGVGIYALAMSYVALLLPISSLGLNDMITRDIAKDRNLASIYLGYFGSLRLLMGLVAYASLMIIVTLIIRYPTNTSTMILLMGISLIPDGLYQVYRSLFAGFERQDLFAITVILLGVINLVLVGWFLHSDADITVTAWARLGSVIFVLVVSMILASKLGILNYLHLASRLDWGWIRRQLAACLPFTFMVILYTVEWRVDVLMLSVFHSATEVGQYYAAETLLLSCLLLLEAYRLAVLPYMSRALQTDPQLLGRVHDRSFYYLLAIATPVAVEFSFLGPQLLSVFNSNFVAAYRILAILMIALVLSFLNEPNGLLLIAGGYQRQLALVFTVSLAVNVGTNLLLIPAHGGIGAAIARVASIGAFAIIAAVLVHRKIRAHWPFRYVLQVIIAVLGMVVVLNGLKHILPWWLAGGAALVVYGLLLIKLHGLPVEDIETLRDRIRLYKNFIRNGRRSINAADDSR